MPTYFFHTADGGRARDPEGIDLPDKNAARKEGIRFAGSLLNHEADVLWGGRDFRVEVTDANDDLLFTVIIVAVDAPAAEKAD